MEEAELRLGLGGWVGFLQGQKKSITGGRSVRSERTYRRDLETARRPVWLEGWVCRKVSGRTVGREGEER